MKKTLYLIILAAICVSCGRSQGQLSMKIQKDCISWTNGTIKFTTDRKHEGLNYNAPAFEAYFKGEDGKTTHMPIDQYALGYGASCPMGDIGFYRPSSLAKAEILSQTDEKLVLHLSYDPWTIYGETIILDKQITIFHDSPVLSVIDYYTGTFRMLNIAAGMTTSGNGTVQDTYKGYTIQYPMGITSLIVMPDADEMLVDETFKTVLLRKAVTNDEPVRYYIGLSDKGMDYLLEEVAKFL